MCMAVPAKVVEIHGQHATVDAMGDQWSINTVFCPDIQCGQVVLVHADFAIATVDPAQARNVWPLIAEWDKFHEDNHSVGD